MGFWSILGNIAAQIGLKLADAVFNQDDKERSSAERQVAIPNWNNIVDVCDGVYNGRLQPIDSIGNMRKSLFEQDPEVLKLALKVLEGVIQERGIPVHNDQEATQFLREMRELLRDTRDRGVMDGVFELNDTWSRACRSSSTFRGVGDLVEMLNSEGYRVLVTRDNRRITNEYADASDCNSCDFELPFDQLKHFCQYCNKIFCSNCCSYEQGIPPFQGNQAVCICHECKSKNNGNFSPRATSNVQTVPKVYNNTRNSSSEQRGPRGLQNVRVGNVKNNEEDVQINLIVPRNVAEDPEGWTISVQCSKTENTTPVVTARTEKKENNYGKWTDEYSKGKLFEKDIWQDNSDSKDIVTKSVMEAKNKNIYLPSKRESYGTRQEEEEEEESAACQLYSSKEELEDEEMKLALERSRQTQVEEMEVRLALELSQRVSGSRAKGNSTSRAFSERKDDDEMFLDITERKHPGNKTHSGNGIVAFEVCGGSQSESQNRSDRSQDCWDKSRQNVNSQGSESDEYDENLQIALRRSLQESTRREERSCSQSENDGDEGSQEGYAYNYTSEPSYPRNRSQEDKDALTKATEEHFKSKFGKGGKECSSQKSEDNWEEEDALQRAIELSLIEVRQSCYNCGKKECICDENVLSRAVQLSKQESVKQQLPSRESRTAYFVLGNGSCMESTGKSTEEELRQKRIRHFEQRNAKEGLESLTHCSKQDAQSPERCEKLQEEECTLSDAAREKTAIIEEAEMKLAMQLSLQEMLEKKENASEESESESNSDG